MATRAATIINAVAPPLAPHGLHAPVSGLGANPEVHAEQRRLVIGVPACPDLCAHDSVRLIDAMSVLLTLKNLPSNFGFGAPKQAAGYKHSVNLR